VVWFFFVLAKIVPYSLKVRKVYQKGFSYSNKYFELNHFWYANVHQSDGNERNDDDAATKKKKNVVGVFLKVRHHLPFPIPKRERSSKQKRKKIKETTQEMRIHIPTDREENQNLHKTSRNFNQTGLGSKQPRRQERRRVELIRTVKWEERKERKRDERTGVRRCR